MSDPRRASRGTLSEDGLEFMNEPLTVGLRLYCVACEADYDVQPDHAGAHLEVGLRGVVVETRDDGSGVSTTEQFPDWWVPCMRCGKDQSVNDPDATRIDPELEAEFLRNLASLRKADDPAETS